MTQGKPNNENEDAPTGTSNGPPGETLTERSIRLEAEAATLAEFDPLAPEEQPESYDEDTSAQEEHQEEESNATDALHAELDEAKDKMMRALAEVENTRRRAQKEREDATKFAITGFAKELLSVSDNLRRALDAVPEDLVEGDIRVKNLLDGIEATERELLRSFERNGIKSFEPLDEPFDPNFHEVMFETPGTGKPAGTIVQIIEIGYELNGRLLRPARVGIAKDEGQGNAEAPSADPGGTIDTEA